MSDDRTELPLTVQQQAIENFLDTVRGHEKHCAQNAIRHLRQAWRLIDTDKEMAAFRALTAEEESVSAIFLALRRHRYVGADHLDHRDHRWKAAVYPFFDSVGTAFAKSPVRDLDVGLEFLESGPNPRVRIRLGVPFPDGKVRHGYPEPPLHFSLILDNRRHSFEPEIRAALSSLNIKSVATLLQKRANRRNMLLYATPRGMVYPLFDLAEFVLFQRKIVFTNLCVFLLIAPYAKKQNFVIQCLEAFLAMLKRLPTVELKARASGQLGKASKVLEYELGMIRYLAAGLTSSIAGQSVIHNSLIESFAVHTRILLTFFFGEKHQKRDVIAAEFFEDPTIWEGKRPEMNARLRTARHMANRQVAHFTEDRFDLAVDDKAWYFNEILRDLEAVFSVFVGLGRHHAPGSKWREKRASG